MTDVHKRIELQDNSKENIVQRTSIRAFGTMRRAVQASYGLSHPIPIIIIGIYARVAASVNGIVMAHVCRANPLFLTHSRWIQLYTDCSYASATIRLVAVPILFHAETAHNHIAR